MLRLLVGRKKADIIPGYPNSLNWILQYAVDLQWRQLPPFIQKWESSKYNATRSIFPGNSWIIWIERRNQNESFTSRITTKSTQLHGYGFRAEASGTIHFNFTSFFQQSWPNNLGKKKDLLYGEENVSFPGPKRQICLCKKGLSCPLGYSESIHTICLISPTYGTSHK